MRNQYAPIGRRRSSIHTIVETLETRRLLSGDGLKGEYFNNLDFTAPVLQRVDPTINFDWGYGSPAAGVGADTFSVRWTGQIEAEKTETYTFYTHSDDGVRLWIDNQLIIDNWTIHAPTTNTGAIDLVAGQKYDIKLEYFDNYNEAVAQLSWSSPTTPKQVIPQQRLYSSAPAADLPVISLTVIDGEASEQGRDPAILRFSQTGDISAPAEVRITTSGTATVPGDIESAINGGYITIPAGQAYVDIPITPVDDDLAEGPETLTVTLDPYPWHTADPDHNSATITIADNDTTKPVISIVATTPDAYEEGQVPGVFTISRTGDTSSDLSIRMGGFGTASGLDFQQTPQLPGYITIPAGQSSVTVTITPVDDDLVEGSETVSLYFMPFVWEYDLYDFQPDSATITIHDNDEPAGSDTVYLSDLTPTTATSAYFPVQKDRSVLGGPLTIGGQTFAKGLGVHASSTLIYELNGDYATFEAWVGVDDAVGDGTGDGSVEFRVYVDDRLLQVVRRTGADPAERIVVNVANAQTLRLEATTGGDSDYKDHADWADARLYASADDKPLVSIEPESPIGDELREDYVTFRIHRTGDTSTPLSVHYSLAGLATVGEDYDLFSPSPTTDPYTITIPANETSVLLSFALNNDDLFEGDETIVVTLVDAPAYRIDASAATETGVIRDDETPPAGQPTLTISAGASSLDEFTHGTTIRIERTGDTTAELPVNLSITGDAVLGSDYIMNVITDDVRIPAGQAFVEFAFNPVRDVEIEGDETALFTLQPGAGYVLGTNSSVAVTIVDNDFPPTVTGETYVSDLTPTAAQSPYYGVQKDRSVLGRPLTIGGQVFARGIGVHSHSEVTYDVPAGANRFTAYVGIDDEVGDGTADGSAVFQVWADGVLIASSPRLTGADGPYLLEVDLPAGTASITLVTTTGGDSDYKDHADWADARFQQLTPNVFF